MSRPQILNALAQLLPAQFEALLLEFDMPHALVRRNATQTEQAIDLIRYAEGRNDLARLTTLLQSPAFPDSGNAAFNQTNQHVGQQFNIAGDVHIHGDAVTGIKSCKMSRGMGIFSLARVM